MIFELTYRSSLIRAEILSLTVENYIVEYPGPINVRLFLDYIIEYITGGPIDQDLEYELSYLHNLIKYTIDRISKHRIEVQDLILDVTIEADTVKITIGEPNEPNRIDTEI